MFSPSVVYQQETGELLHVLHGHLGIKGHARAKIHIFKEQKKLLRVNPLCHQNFILQDLLLFPNNLIMYICLPEEKDLISLTKSRTRAHALLKALTRVDKYKLQEHGEGLRSKPFSWGSWAFLQDLNHLTIMPKEDVNLADCGKFQSISWFQNKLTKDLLQLKTKDDWQYCSREAQSEPKIGLLLRPIPFAE